MYTISHDLWATTQLQSLVLRDSALTVKLQEMFGQTENLITAAQRRYMDELVCDLQHGGAFQQRR